MLEVGFRIGGRHAGLLCIWHCVGTSSVCYTQYPAFGYVCTRTSSHNEIKNIRRQQHKAHTTYGCCCRWCGSSYVKYSRTQRRVKRSQYWQLARATRSTGLTCLQGSSLCEGFPSTHYTSVHTRTQMQDSPSHSLRSPTTYNLLSFSLPRTRFLYIHQIRPKISAFLGTECSITFCSLSHPLYNKQIFGEGEWR